MKLMKQILISLLMSAVAFFEKPNIVYILADDMGYGDLSALNPEGKIKTPPIDRIAREGMIFTDVHTSSAVCNPSRYLTLTEHTRSATCSSRLSLFLLWWIEIRDG